MDTNITIGLRRKMIDELRTQLNQLGYQDFEPILDVISQIKRHEFAPIGFESISYEIRPVVIDENQTMSSPLTVAIQTLLLNIISSDRILEIGTGSGYQGMVLSYLCQEVHTLERHTILNQKATERFQLNKIANIKTYLKDGFEGLSNKAPFDKIIVTCGADQIPISLLEQLKVGGIMIIPVTNSENKRVMKKIYKLSEEETYEENYGEFEFVPMLNGVNEKI